MLYCMLFNTSFCALAKNKITRKSKFEELYALLEACAFIATSWIEVMNEEIALCSHPNSIANEKKNEISNFVFRIFYSYNVLIAR